MNNVFLPMPKIQGGCLPSREQGVIGKPANRWSRGWYLAFGDSFAHPRLSAGLGLCRFRGSSRDKYGQPDQQAIDRLKTFELQHLTGLLSRVPIWESKLHTNFTLNKPFSRVCQSTSGWLEVSGLA
jgi:hypothetical protein